MINKESILIIIRSEGDFERAISIGREAITVNLIFLLFLLATLPRFLKTESKIDFKKNYLLKIDFKFMTFQILI